MPNWKKLIVSGSDANLNSLDVLASITGSTFLVNDIISIADGTAAAPSLRFTDDPDTGIYRSTDNTFNITVGGTNMFAINSSGITSGANVYSGTTGQFRNFAGVWKATTGTTGNGFNFSSADLSDLLTISSTGDSVFKGDITITDTTGTRGISRNNTGYNLNLMGGTDLTDGAYISLSGEGRGGASNSYNGRIEIYSGGGGLANQAAALGDIIFGTKWNGGSSNILVLDSSTNNATFAGDIDADDITINDWNSVSASLSTLTQNQTLNSGGTVDYVARFESANTITTGVIRDDGSTVGINAAPSANKTLYIDGTIQATGEAFFSHLDIIGSGGNSRIRDDIQFKFGTNRIFGIRYNSSGDYLEFTSGSNNLVTLLGNGNVGIGTTSPSKVLTVEGAISASGDIHIDNNQGLVSKNVAGADRTLIELDSSNTLKIKGNDSEGSTNVITMVTGGDVTFPADVTVAGTITAQEFHTEFVSASIIYESGSTKFGDTSEDIHSFSGSLRVTGSGDHYFTDGNVGIGTTTPIRTFHVEKATTYPGRFSYDSNNYLDIGYDSLNVKGGSLLFRNDGTEHLRINTTGALKAALYGSGNFTGTLAYSLGVDSSGNVIEFTGGSGGSVSSITNGADNRLAIFTGADSLEGDPNLTFDGTNFYVNGNIGIGTATPGEALEVVGNVEAEEFIGDLRGAVLFKAQAGEALSKGDVVYISGISGNTTVVSKADADDANKMPAFGVAAAAASLSTPIDIYTVGTLTGLDTSGFTIGDELYVSSSAGELTATAPTGESSLIQKIAKVTRVDNAAGSIKISGAGRTNATPNLNEGRLFVGNASNQAVADGTIHVDIANTRVGIGTTNPTQTLEVNGAVLAGDYRGSTHIYLTSPDSWIFRSTGGTERMKVDSAGSLLLGNTTAYQRVIFDPTPSTVLGNGTLTITPSTAPGSGTAQFYTRFLDRSGGGITKHNVIVDGKVGIGTTAPAAKLHVDAGSSDEVARFVSTDNKAYITISDDDTTGYVSSENGLFSLGRNAGVNAANINIDASNNVGIGTSNPGAKLDVHGRVDFANDLRLRGTDSAADQGVVRFYVNSNNELTIDSANNGNNLFVIDEGGQVGINTSSPSRTLDVNGEIQNNGIFRKGGNVIIKSTGSETMFGPGGSGIITFHNSATMTTSDETIRIDANGNLLLNNTSAGARLDIREDTNYAIQAEDASGHYFRVNTGGDVDMRGDLTVQGIITAQEFHTEFVSASILFDSGSTKFGDTLDDNHDFTGSVNVSGSMVLTDNTKLQLGSNSTAGDLRIFHTGTVSKIANNTGNLEITQFVDDGDIIFNSDDGSGNTTEYFRVDGGEEMNIFTKKVGIGTTSTSRMLHVVGGTEIEGTLFVEAANNQVRLVDSDSSGNFSVGVNTHFQIRDVAGNTTPVTIQAGTPGNTLFLKSDGNVGIGTTGPATKLHVSSSTFNDHITLGRDSDELGITVSGGQVLVEGGLSPFINDAEDLGRSDKHWQDLYITDNIYVSQSAVLGLAGGLNATGDLSGSDVHIDDWGSVSASLSSIQQAGGVNGTGASNKVAIWSDSDTLTSDTNLHWDSSNDRLGIGSDSPAFKTTIYSDSTTDSFPLVVGQPNAANEFVGIGLSGFVASNGAVKAGLVLDRKNTYGVGDIHILNNTTTDNSNATLADSKFTILQNGNVGIGTTSPALKLEIEGGDGLLQLSTNSSTGNPYMSFNQAGSRKSFIQHTDSGDYLKLASEYGGISFFTGTGGTETEKMRILSGGNVGIGTNNPVGKLDVEGDVQIKSANISYQENTDVDSAAAETIATVTHASYDAAFFDYVVKNGTNLRAGIVMAVHDGTNVEYTDNSTKDIGDTTGVTFSVDISGTDLRLRATTTTDNWTIKTLVRTL